MLDNVEHVVEAGPLVADLLRSCPNLKVLATSRVRLRLSGEHEHSVPPLAMTAPGASAGGEAPVRSEAVRLFVARAQEVREDFVLTPELAPVVATICHRLDGLPLAIELAAARIKVLPAPALLDRLERRLPLLTGGGRDLPERQRTMANTIAWSYDLLTPAEQRLFRHLGVFVGGFDLEAAEAVAGAEERAGAIIFDGMAALVEQSLLRQVEGSDQEPRYSMLETVREFALDRLAATGEVDRVRAAHAMHFVSLAERLVPDADWGAIRPWLGRVDTEHPNFRAALEWLAASHDPEPFLRLATRLWGFWYDKGHLREGWLWLEQAVARVDETSTLLHAKALHHAGQLAHYLGDDEQAVSLLGAALARLRGGDGSWLTPHALMVLGIVEEDRGQYERAEPLLRQALARYREVGEQSLATLTVCHLGITAYGTGDFVRATALFDEALSLAGAMADSFCIAEALLYLGLMSCDQGDTVRAVACLEQGLPLVLADGDREGTSHYLALASVLSARCGQADRAARLSAAADAVRGEIGVISGLPERARYEAAAMTARAALGEEAFAAACMEGRALSLDAAIAEVRQLVEFAAAAAVIATPADRLGLTPREQEVRRLLVEGRSDKEIGAALYLSHRTVMRHVTGILAKLAVENRTAATHYAVRHGLV